MTEKASIFEALNTVAAEVGAVRKGDRNQQQGFNFRGVDAVVNAVAPALRKAGVIIVPFVEHVEHTTVEVGRNRTLMGHCRVRVRYTWYGPAGDSVDAVVVAESMDAGDKASPKAMSVAYRTAILQTLALPTDDPEPDAQAYQRSGRKEGSASEPPGTDTRKSSGDDSPIADSQRKAIMAGFNELGITDRDVRLQITRRLADEPDLESTNALTVGKARLVLAGINERRRVQAEQSGGQPS